MPLFKQTRIGVESDIWAQVVGPELFEVGPEDQDAEAENPHLHL